MRYSLLVGCAVAILPAAAVAQSEPSQPHQPAGESGRDRHPPAVDPVDARRPSRSSRGRYRGASGADGGDVLNGQLGSAWRAPVSRRPDLVVPAGANANQTCVIDGSGSITGSTTPSISPPCRRQHRADRDPARTAERAVRLGGARRGDHIVTRTPRRGGRVGLGRGRHYDPASRPAWRCRADGELGVLTVWGDGGYWPPTTTGPTAISGLERLQPGHLGPRRPFLGHAAGTYLLSEAGSPGDRFTNDPNDYLRNENSLVGLTIQAGRWSPGKPGDARHATNAGRSRRRTTGRLPGRL